MIMQIFIDIQEGSCIKLNAGKWIFQIEAASDSLTFRLRQFPRDTLIAGNYDFIGKKN